ncbi:MAG: TatD family hydrolase [Chloroflexales bacterium]|nr:TatD family hydrolase [Chloroflexales bacterium]
MLIDAHAHLDQYDDDAIAAVFAEVCHHQVLTISVAMDPSSYWRAMKLSTQCRMVVPTFGIHPWNAPTHVHDLDTLRPFVFQSPMLGEIGLDFYWVDDAAQYPAQREVLAFFLEAARTQGKIVNLHTKGAEAEVLQMLDAYAIERAIVHWYSGPMDVFQAMIARGVYFTIGVEVCHSARIQALAQALPLSLLLTETDNPGGQAWLQGEAGMPRHLTQVVETLADIKHTTPSAIVQTVQENFLRLIQDDLWLAPVRARLSV